DWHRAQRGLSGAAKSDGNAALYREFSGKYTQNIEILGVPVRNREVFGVLHLKGFIIDDKVIYSGASLTDVYLAEH
ncbi:CDP-diacylglycerol--serine O-phosphatidyltransferase, partial [Photobacterium damselae]